MAPHPKFGRPHTELLGKIGENKHGLVKYATDFERSNQEHLLRLYEVTINPSITDPSKRKHAPALDSLLDYMMSITVPMIENNLFKSGPNMEPVFLPPCDCNDLSEEIKKHINDWLELTPEGNRFIYDNIVNAQAKQDWLGLIRGTVKEQGMKLKDVMRKTDRGDLSVRWERFDAKLLAKIRPSSKLPLKRCYLYVPFVDVVPDFELALDGSNLGVDPTPTLRMRIHIVGDPYGFLLWFSLKRLTPKEGEESQIDLTTPTTGNENDSNPLKTDAKKMFRKMVPEEGVGRVESGTARKEPNDRDEYRWDGSLNAIDEVGVDALETPGTWDPIALAICPPPKVELVMETEEAVDALVAEMEEGLVEKRQLYAKPPSLEDEQLAKDLPPVAEEEQSMLSGWLKLLKPF